MTESITESRRLMAVAHQMAQTAADLRPFAGGDAWARVDGVDPSKAQALIQHLETVSGWLTLRALGCPPETIAAVAWAEFAEAQKTNRLDEADEWVESYRVYRCIVQDQTTSNEA